MRYFIISSAILLGAVGLNMANDESPANSESIERELAKFQGFWKVEQAFRAGEPAPAERRERMSLTFKGNQVIKDEDQDDPGTVKLDPKQSPAHFDLIDKSGAASLGIYQIEGDTLKLCVTVPGEERPKTFESTPETRAFYFVLKRTSK